MMLVFFFYSMICAEEELYWLLCQCLKIPTQSWTRLFMWRDSPPSPPKPLRHTDLIVKFFDTRLPGCQGQGWIATLEQKRSFRAWCKANRNLSTDFHENLYIFSYQKSAPLCSFLWSTRVEYKNVLRTKPEKSFCHCGNVLHHRSVSLSTNKRHFWNFRPLK